MQLKVPVPEVGAFDDSAFMKKLRALSGHARNMLDRAEIAKREHTRRYFTSGP
jgi:hypothetical protein